MSDNVIERFFEPIRKFLWEGKRGFIPEYRHAIVYLALACGFFVWIYKVYTSDAFEKSEKGKKDRWALLRYAILYFVLGFIGLAIL